MPKDGLSKIGSEERKPELVWVCTRCNHALKGNPRFCPWCSYTVYRPTWPKDKP